MRSNDEWSITRRGLLAGTAAVSAGLLTTSATRAQDATPEPPTSALGPIPSGGVAADGSWSFTDDRGVTATRDTVPTKVVAYIGIAGALHDFGFDVVGFFSGEAREAVDPATLAPDLPFDSIQDFGYADEIDVEALIELGVELFVGANYGVEGAQVIWPVSDDAIAQIESFASVIAIAFADGTNTDRTIQTIGNLAEALGADLSSQEIADARSAYEAETANLESALAARPGLKAFFMSAFAEGFWVGFNLADINFYEAAGLERTGPSNWDPQSWESFGDIDADVIFLDKRGPQWWQPEQLEESVPVWPMHPAVAAGQVYPWTNEYVASYQGFTPVIQDVVAAIEAAQVLA